MSDSAALESLVERIVTRRIRESASRIATVQSVNDADGTVNLDIGGGVIVPGCPAMAGYSPRAAGDLVAVRGRLGALVVEDKVGGPASLAGVPQVHVDDAAPPSGSGYEAIVTDQLWVRTTAGYAELWCKRVTAAPPATSATLTVTAVDANTYRNGVMRDNSPGVAEQGDGGNPGYPTGLQTGVYLFAANAFTALSGKTVTAATVTLHRVNRTHGYTDGRVPTTVWRCATGGTFPAATPTLDGDGTAGGSLAKNETRTTSLPAWFAQSFADGTADSLALYSEQITENVETDVCELVFTYNL